MREVNLPTVAEEAVEFQQGWDFVEPVPAFVLPLEPVTAGANANDDVSATLVGVVPRACRLLGGYLCVSANSTGVAAGSGNDSVWVVTVGGVTALTKTNAAALVADTPVSLGTPAITDMAAGTAIKLAITNGANADLNSAVCHVSLICADVVNFPAPGLKVIATNGGTVTIADGVKGVVALSPGAVDNDEIYLCGSLELYKFAASKTFIAEALIQFTEANTDDANVCFGFMNAVAADSIVDNGGGPKATGDYACIWKIDGGTKWYCGVQSNGTATPTTDTLGSKTPAGMTPVNVTAGGTAYQRLTVKVRCESSTAAVAEFYVDGVNIGTINFAYASATEMQVFVGVKDGGANAETLNVDYLGARSVR
jgi:hypothetical protein